MSNTTGNLLVELLVEELPPKSLKKLGDSFAEIIVANLKTLGLTANDTVVTAFASPRRLAVHVENVVTQAADKSASQKLMPVAVGLDANGQATPALLKKLNSLRDVTYTSASELRHALDGKVEALFLDRVVKGATLLEGLQKAIDEALVKLPIVTMMSYQLSDGWSTVNFVRPVHGLVALHGAEIVPISALGLTAGRETQGHRFEASVKAVVLRDADSYVQQLESEGAVIPSFRARQKEIVRELNAVSTDEGLTPVEDAALLDEVTALVERPNVLVGEFESGFLQVPQECLILTMKVNQKYFPLLDTDGKLSNKFLIVSNIRPGDANRIVTGNELVLRSRLADAIFFFNQDRRKTLASRVEGLRKVVYHNRLGTQAERVERISALAQAIGLQLGDSELAARAGEAAMLCKADLLTDMVGEFPELQGVMGKYYARYDGLTDEVADAIEDHYKPRFAGDELPRSMTGVCVGLADKLETLVGMFGIGLIPTGDKDPFALRRHALGVVRILVEKELALSLDSLLEQTINIFGDGINDPSAVLSEFIYERLRYYFSIGSFDEQALESDKQVYLASAKNRLGFSPQQIDAVLALRPQRLSDIKNRLDAVRAFARLPEAESLAAANKRVRNILKKANAGTGENRAIKVNTEFLQMPAERILHQALSQVAPEADAAFTTGDYTGSLQMLATLRKPIDDFFDNVMVNTEDEILRNNRLALLAQLQQAMNRVADISKLAT